MTVGELKTFEPFASIDPDYANAIEELNTEFPAGQAPVITVEYKAKNWLYDFISDR